ncbi:hypothetical protein ACUMLB_003449 [Escherichia coli]|nr:hypothetical protein [Escherichia coli]EJI0954878.1 hypothetical protein [Escherichia coli]EKG6774965.1 hypothetical protein [Escherichia coli]ELX1524408.1 hypothetical protein [Escherichia coli]
MTTPITKERLEEIIHAAGLEPCNYEETFSSITTGEIVKMARIALASLETEPEHWKVLNELNLIIGIYNDRESVERKAAEWRTNRIIPLYAAPPASVVPEEMTKSLASIAEEYQTTPQNALFIVVGWNACRAAILQGGKS